jgi:hypothetical protein
METLLHDFLLIKNQMLYILIRYLIMLKKEKQQ